MCKRLGLMLAAMHVALFLGSVIYVYTAVQGQASLIWVVWAVIDFPVSLLYMVIAEPYSRWLGTLSNDGAPLQHVMYLPHVIHGVLGTLWWYQLPRLCMPKRLGGFWGEP